MKPLNASRLFVGLLSAGMVLMSERPSAAADQTAAPDRAARAQRPGKGGRGAAADRQARRGALAGPASRPAGANAADRQGRPRGEMFFQVLDRNRDGKLQPAEIGHLITVLTEAQNASRKADLTPEEFSKYLHQLRPARGNGPRTARDRSR